MDTITVHLGSIKYNCIGCNYTTKRKSQYDRHLLTSKHKRIHDYIENSSKKFKTYKCDNCNNEYKFHSGLWKHKKTCTHKPDPANDVTESEKCEPLTEETINSSSKIADTNVVTELLKQNQEYKSIMFDLVKENKDFKQLLIEQNHKMMELAGKVGNNNNNTTNNNKFNLNFFLNETCKNAITMNEFINSIEVSMEDFIHTGNIGFVDGISKVMVKRIKDMELHTRPMHCTDLKRETVYIKDNEKWEKDDTDKSSLRRAVKTVANKNYKQLQKWYDNSKPEVEQIGSEDCENYFKYYKASLGGYDKDEDKKFEEKIIKNVLKEVVLDKNV